MLAVVRGGRGPTRCLSQGPPGRRQGQGARIWAADVFDRPMAVSNSPRLHMVEHATVQGRLAVVPFEDGAGDDPPHGHCSFPQMPIAALAQATSARCRTGPGGRCTANVPPAWLDLDQASLASTAIAPAGHRAETRHFEALLPVAWVVR